MGEVSSEAEGVASTESLLISLLGNSTRITLELTRRDVPSSAADDSVVESSRLLVAEETWSKP